LSHLFDENKGVGKGGKKKNVSDSGGKVTTKKEEGGGGSFLGFCKGNASSAINKEGSKVKRGKGQGAKGQKHKRLHSKKNLGAKNQENSSGKKKKDNIPWKKVAQHYLLAKIESGGRESFLLS